MPLNSQNNNKIKFHNSSKLQAKKRKVQIMLPQRVPKGHTMRCDYCINGVVGREVYSIKIGKITEGGLVRYFLNYARAWEQVSSE